MGMRCAVLACTCIYMYVQVAPSCKSMYCKATMYMYIHDIVLVKLLQYVLL